MDFFATGGFQQLFSDLLQEEDENNDSLMGNTDNELQILGRPEMVFCVNLKHAHNENVWSATGMDSNCQGIASPLSSRNELDLENTSPLFANETWSYLDTMSYNDQPQRIYDGLPTMEIDVASKHLTELLAPQESEVNNNISEEDPKKSVSISNEKDLQSAFDSFLCESPKLLTKNFYNYQSTILRTSSSPDLHDMMTDWEQKFLDDFVELPELVDYLPVKTALCTSTCELFLHESSANLRLDSTTTVSPIKSDNSTKTRSRKISSTSTTKARQKTTAHLNRRKKVINNNKIEDIQSLFPDENQSTIGILEETSSPTSKANSLTLSTYTSSISNTSIVPNGNGEVARVGYPCHYASCRNIYAKPAHLKAHLRRHLGEKPYACTWPDCVWKFSRSDELARHRRSHSGVKPYKCVYCTKCFARSDHLTKHRKVHERRMIAASREGRAVNGVLPASVFTVRPGRKRKNQVC